MIDYFVTFFINRSYHTMIVRSDSEENAEKLIKEKYPNANLITVHLRIPGLY